MMTERAPSEPPHWHAQFLGVLPGRQRQGLGGRLFRYGLEISDADGLPTYLEASTPENARLYRRLGFRVTHDDDRKFYMRREPTNCQPAG